MLLLTNIQSFHSLEGRSRDEVFMFIGASVKPCCCQVVVFSQGFFTSSGFRFPFYIYVLAVLLHSVPSRTNDKRYATEEKSCHD